MTCPHGYENADYCKRCEASTDEEIARQAARDRQFRAYIEVVEQTFKNRVPGIPAASIRPGCLYVLDWGKAIKVEEVTAIQGNVVEMPTSTTDLETFASLVVGGPFPLT